MTALLVRHPAPSPTESLFGYILRLSETNGYTTPWSLFSLAGMGQHEIRTTGIKIGKLAQVTGRSQAELEAISYRWRGDRPRGCRLLGHLLIPQDLTLTRPKLCPQCAAERGFVEAHFDLALMTGCPVHKRSLLSRCPTCTRPLRWFRPGLLECHCGASFLDSDLPSISLAEADLLDIVRRKTLGLGSAAECASGLPSSHLEVMSLRSLLALIGILGKRRLVVEGNGDRKNPRRIALAAAKVLADWPNNFCRLLGAMEAGLPENSSRGVSRGELRGIYSSLFKQKWITPTEHADFLRTAFLEFMKNRQGTSFIDSKLMKRVRAAEPERFVSRAAFARRYGIDSRTATRFLEGEALPSRRFRWGSSERELVDIGAVRLPCTAPGRIYRVRRAAATIGISVNLLRSLRASGDFEVNHQPRMKAGFHELDVEAFIEKLKGLAPSVGAASVLPHKFVAFARVAHGPGCSVAVKATIVRAMLSGELPIVGNIDGTVSGLLLPHDECEHLANDARARASGDARTPSEAAQHLKCDSGSIPSLVEMGLLRGRRVLKGLRITEESIAEFNRRYVSVASIANTIGTSSRALMNFCFNRGIPMVHAQKQGNRGTQAFVRVEQKQELLGFRYRRTAAVPLVPLCG